MRVAVKLRKYSMLSPQKQYPYLFGIMAGFAHLQR